MQSLNQHGQFRFIQPHPALKRYLSSYYFFEIDAGDELPQDDLLYPEWASARFMLRGSIPAAVVPDPLEDVPRVSMTGPTSRAVRIQCVSAVMVGIGMLPLGWMKFCSPSADAHGDRVVDVESEPGFSLFAAIWQDIKSLSDPESIAAKFDEYLLAALKIASENPAKELEIERVHTALANPEIADVAALEQATGLTVQQLERLCRRTFGFTPKKLLRRQRFLRSLAVQMMNPDMKWSNALDPHYHDQAHFNRDFRDFMGMSPSEYLAMPRPISRGAVLARNAALGDPLQVLQSPPIK